MCGECWKTRRSWRVGVSWLVCVDCSPVPQYYGSSNDAGRWKSKDNGETPSSLKSFSTLWQDYVFLYSRFKGLSATRRDFINQTELVAALRHQVRKPSFNRIRKLFFIQRHDRQIHWIYMTVQRWFLPLLWQTAHYIPETMGTVTRFVTYWTRCFQRAEIT